MKYEVYPGFYGVKNPRDVVGHPENKYMSPVVKVSEQHGNIHKLIPFIAEQETLDLNKPQILGFLT